MLADWTHKMKKAKKSDTIRFPEGLRKAPCQAKSPTAMHFAAQRKTAYWKDHWGYVDEIAENIRIMMHLSPVTRERDTPIASCKRSKPDGKGIHTLGLKKGRPPGHMADEHSRMDLTQYATAKAGIIMVNINPAYRTHELEYSLRQSEAQVLLLMDGSRARITSRCSMRYALRPKPANLGRSTPRSCPS